MMHSNCRISCMDEPSEENQMKKQKLEPVAGENNDDGEGVDRISRLCPELVHYIMSFLPQLDVAGISTLSKTFQSLWSSFPIIVFDQKLFDVDIPGNLDWNRSITSTDMFLDFVVDSIQLRRLESSLQKFNLRCYLYDDESDSRIDSAITFAVANNVKELVLRIIGKDKDDGELYQYFEEKFFPKSVTSLKLKGFHLNLSLLLLTCKLMESLVLHDCLVWGNTSPDESSIGAGKSLRLVSFVNLKISEEWIHNHVPRFGNLEMLKLSRCSELKNFKISHKNVKEINLDYNDALESAKIDAPQLHSFRIVGSIERICTIDITSCKLVKNLYLSHVFITEEWLKAHISLFEYLESLRLVKCVRLKRIEIVSKCLQSLELRDCTNLVEVKVDTPNLLSFEYTGSSVSFALMNSPRLRNPIIRLLSSGTTIEWFARLRDMLTMFDHCESLTLACKSKDLMFPAKLRASRLSPLYDIKMLQVNLNLGSRIGTELVNNLLWLTPLLETLRLNSNFTEKFIKLGYSRNVAEDEQMQYCCQHLPIKCWRHSLKKVEMQNIEDGDDRDGLLEYFKEECQFAGNTCPSFELQQVGPSSDRFLPDFSSYGAME